MSTPNENPPRNFSTLRCPVCFKPGITITFSDEGSIAGCSSEDGCNAIMAFPLKITSAQNLIQCAQALREKESERLHEALRHCDELQKQVDAVNHMIPRVIEKATAFCELEKERDELKAWKESALREHKAWSPVYEYLANHPETVAGQVVSEVVLKFLKERDEALRLSVQNFLAARDAASEKANLRHRVKELETEAGGSGGLIVIERDKLLARVAELESKLEQINEDSREHGEQH